MRKKFTPSLPPPGPPHTMVRKRLNCVAEIRGVPMYVIEIGFLNFKSLINQFQDKILIIFAQNYFTPGYLCYEKNC